MECTTISLISTVVSQRRRALLYKLTMRRGKIFPFTGAHSSCSPRAEGLGGRAARRWRRRGISSLLLPSKFPRPTPTCPAAVPEARRRVRTLAFTATKVDRGCLWPWIPKGGPRLMGHARRTLHLCTLRAPFVTCPKTGRPTRCS